MKPLKDVILFVYIYIYTLLVSVCLCPIYAKTSEPIGPKFCVGPHMTPGHVYIMDAQNYQVCVK